MCLFCRSLRAQTSGLRWWIFRMDFSFSFQIPMKSYKMKKYPQTGRGLEKGLQANKTLKQMQGDREQKAQVTDGEKPRIGVQCREHGSGAHSSGQSSQPNTERLESEGGHQTECLIKGLSTVVPIGPFSKSPLTSQGETNIRYLLLSKLKNQKALPKDI